LTSHTGNIHVVVSDRKLVVDANSNNIFDAGDYFTADVVATYDYYAGVGMVMPGRSFDNGYRYGAQGSEVDGEIQSDRNTISTFFREGSLETGQWWSLDPKPSAGVSPYAMFNRNPVLYNDVFGDSIGVPKNLFNTAMAGSEGYNNEGLNLKDWNTFSSGVTDVTGISLNTPSLGDNTLSISSIDENVGSGTARGLFKKALTDNDVINTELVHGSSSVDGAAWFGRMKVGSDGQELGWDMKSSTLKIDMDDIGAIKYKNVDSRAFGLGLILGHELTHRYYLKDNVTLTNPRGATVDFMNKARTEMGMGLRLTYNPQQGDWQPGSNYILRFGEILPGNQTITKGAVFLPFNK